MLMKDITFIYMDPAEMAAYEPIANEARKRGYAVNFTKNKFQKCQIGFYCQHINFPQYSKFSVIMLHDIIQQYAYWPDLWYREPWDKYDIGIIPSAQWEENWNQCSQWKYTRPKLGVYKIGWPKADAILRIEESTFRDNFYKKYGLDVRKKTVLYAPSWENDHKQDDFVKAMLPLDVNIIIKQAEYDAKIYPDRVKDVMEMYELHKDIDRVTILPASTNIFEAIAVSDVLVSEESSTMCEATMMGIPAVSVSNWLIPDVTPKRLPKCDYDFVISTKKEDLTNCISKVLANYNKYKKQTIEYANSMFSNIGQTSSMIMDIIDDCVANRKIRYDRLEPQKLQKVPFKKNILRYKEQIWRTMWANWREQYPLFKFFWFRVKKIKDTLMCKRKVE